MMLLTIVDSAPRAGRPLQGAPGYVLRVPDWAVSDCFLQKERRVGDAASVDLGFSGRSFYVKHTRGGGTIII